MPEITAYAMSRHFADLVGRKVTFAQAALTLDGSIKQVYGVYTVLPGNTPVVAKLDLPLLASMAGSLVGLPDATIKEKLKTSGIDELLRDAMHEILNVASTVVANTGRAVFKQMLFDKTFISGAAEAVLVKPGHRSYFNVTVDGYQGGRFSLFSPILAINS